MGPSFRFRRLVVAVAVAVAVMISAATGAFFTFAEENGVPEKPTGLVTLAGDTQVQLSWENPKDTTVSKYQLWQLAQSAKLTADITKDNRFGYSVAVDVDTAVIGVPGDGSTAVTEAGAAYVFTRNTGTGVWSQAAKLTASDRASNDEFGISVAVDGETVVVGAHQHDIGTNSAAGAAYVYTKPGGGWAGNITETAKLTASDRASDDEFGISVAADGGTVVVGAAGVDGTDAGGAAVTEAGAAYVFTLNTGTGVWSQAAKLTASDRASDDEFGISVAVDGETVVVGAHQHDIGTNSAAGAAYVYTKPGGGWAGNITETAKLTASDRASDDEFGISVAADGGTVVVGAAGVDGTDAGGAAVTEAGAAYVFTLNTGTGVWSQAAKLTASDRASDDEFGISVAVDGGTVVAGAAGVDGTDAGGAAVTEAGAAYVFTLNTGTGVWSQAAKLTASDRASDDEFGISVAVDGGTVVAGAAGVDGTDAGGAAVTEAGAAYVFTLNTGTGVWSQAAKLTASDLVSYDEFGISVAVDGGTVVVGAAGVDGTDVGGAAVTEAGAAYVFTLNTGTGVWSPAARLTASDRASDDEFGISVAVDGDTVVVGGDQNGNGAAYVYTKPGGGWATTSTAAKLTASGGAANDKFGISVAVDGDTVVVGGDQNGNGAAYVFTKPDTGWATTSTAAKLTASGGGADDKFGVSVAVDGETVVVGGDQNGNGAAYVFTKPSGSVWANATETAKLTAFDGKANDEFGISVAVDGETVVVGAHKHDIGSKSNAGAAYVYIKPGSVWANATETAKLTAFDGKATDEFGISVAVDGETVVVGAHKHDIGSKSNAGAAYVYTKPGSVWANATESAKPTASGGAKNDEFGSSVAIDGDTVMVGAYAHDNGDSDNTANSGAAYVFDTTDWYDIAVVSKDQKISHIVTGLTNDMGHNFRIRAENSNGFSDPSGYVVETPKAYPPARPVDFSAKQTDDGEVELAWDAHGYPLTVAEYQFTQNAGSGATWTTIAGSGPSTDSHTVDGLTAGTTYTFAVRAVNSAFSTASDSRSVTIVAKPGEPDPFITVAGDGHVWLGWRSPADFSISGYQYQQKTGGDFDDVWTNIPGSRSGTTFHIVTGLNNGTSYTFRVRAVNAAGGSDPSNEKNATPAEAALVPAKPEGFSVKQVGDGEVELTWDPSANPLNVTSYQFKQDTGGWVDIARSDHSTVSHLVSGLDAGDYNFAVRAKNGVGNGVESSQSVTVVPKPAAPTWPTEGAAEEGDTQVGLTWINPVNAPITRHQLLQFPESIKLVASDRTLDDQFGWSVAVDGDTVVIGALADDNPTNSGSAYVFTRDAGGWTRAGKLTAKVPRAQARFGYSVAVHGDTIVVGAYEENHYDSDGNLVLSDAGAAYVFTKPANGWADMTQTARLIASDAANGDEFGTSVAVHGDTIVVGAAEQGEHAKGSAYIFTKSGDVWGNDPEDQADLGKYRLETARLSGRSNGDRFGRSVAVHGNTIVVGAPEEGNKKGAAYVFTKSAVTGVWDDWDNESASDATAKLTASDRQDNDRFGVSVGMDGDTIVVGAYIADSTDEEGDPVSNSGAAYVFTKVSGVWSQVAKLTASDGAATDEFGISVSVDGDIVVVGAHQDNANGGNSGSAYVFTKPDTGGWVATGTADQLTAYDGSGNDRFGYSVAVDGNTVLIGAKDEDDNGTEKGAAYVFGTEAVWTDIPGSGPRTISHIARGLANKAEYTSLVRAVNRAGAGAASVDRKATPVAAAVPVKPEGFSATQIGVGQVKLVWGLISRLTVTGYQYRQNDGGAWTTVSGSDSGTNSHTVTGLTAGDTYTFAVRAINSAGEGPASDSLIPVAQLSAPSGFTADAGDTLVTLQWGDRGQNPPALTNYEYLQRVAGKLTAADGLGDDHFGYSVAVDGDTAVIGAYQDDHTDENGTVDDTGAAYVFTKNSDGTWTQAAKLTAPGRAENDQFGYSVAVDGDTVVVGVPFGDDDTFADVGSAYVFTRPNTGWGGEITEPVKLNAFGAAANDEFGISVAVDGNTILVGAHQNDADTKNNDEGAAYIFTRFADVWGNASASRDHRVETAKLIPSDAAPGDRFGISVAVDSDTAVIGAHQDAHTDGGGNTIDNAGSAYVFTKVSGVWSQKAKLVASDGAADDYFGFSVGVDGDFIVVGAYGNDANDDDGLESNDIADSGSVYLFTRDSNNEWSQADKLVASDAEADDQFGYSVAVDGETVLVGAYQDDENGDQSGSVYVFTGDSEGMWSQTAKRTAPDGAAGDRYGYSVAISGTNVLVGAYSADRIYNYGTKVPDTGAAYFWSISDWADIPDSGGGTTSYDVPGLTNGVEYAFQVRGVNDAGAGLASASASGIPQIPKPGQPTGLGAEAGDTQATVRWRLPPGDAPPIAKYQLLQVPLSKLTATDAAMSDKLGYSVAIHGNGNTAVVGAPGDDSNQGAAYIFTKDSEDKWSQKAKLTASTREDDDEFGYSVAVDADTIVVGAPWHNSKQGAVYVFNEPDSGGWVDTSTAAKLTAGDGAANDQFGYSVALDADTIVVGAPWHNSKQGAVYVFNEPDSGGWVDTSTAAKLTAGDGAANDQFGYSVALDADTIVVGAPWHNSKQGAVYVFNEPDSGGWVDTSTAAKLTAGDGAANDQFGYSVALDADTIVVGAPWHNSKQGAVYVFNEPDSGGWVDTSTAAKLTAGDGTDSDEFGISVALDGDKAVVGAHMDDRDNAVPDSGSVYVFTRETVAWNETVQLAAPDAFSTDHFGNSVALSGGTVLAGAPLDDDNAADSGSAYVMDVGRTDATIWADVNPLELISDSADYYYRTLGLINDQEYAFRVRAVNAGGNTPSAETRSAVPLLKKPDRPTGLTAEAGSRRVNLSWDRSYDSTITGYQALTLKIDKLTTSDRKEDDNFGSAVAMDDGIAVVGSPQDHTRNGAAYIFIRDSGGAWSEVAQLTASDGALDDEFGHSVAVNGDTIVIGAPQDDDNGSNSGSAYVFTKPTTSGGWADTTGIETAKLTASDGAAADEFGHSVAVDGDTVVIGARGDDDNGSNSGSAYVFTKPASEGGWSVSGDTDVGTGQVKHTETAQLTDSDGKPGDRFGQSVAVQSTDAGDTVVVGAHLDDDIDTDAANAGAVYVLTEPGNGWEGWNALDNLAKENLTAKLTVADGEAEDNLGYSVAIDGDTVVAGAQREDDFRGAVYVFTDPGGGWATGTETARLTASDRQGNEYFGYSVAVHGGVVVIGAYAADIDPEYSNENLSSGAAYVFTKPGNAWVEGTETAKLILPNSDGMDGTEEDDDFGNSVAVDSESIIIGAPLDDVVVEDNQEVLNAGSMYASGIPQWTLIDPSNDTTTSHTVYELIGGVEYTFQVRAVDEVGSSPPSNIVHATPRGSSGGGTEPPNYGPSFVSGNNLTPAVDENAPPGTPVGSPITATDPEDDDLTYYLQGDDAFPFGIVAETGQLTVKDPLDYEVKSLYRVTVRVNDNSNPSKVVDVTIKVNNLDETGTISLSSQQTKVGTALTAEVSDPDGSVTGVTCQWASSPDLVNWQNIAGATSNIYTPVAQDVDRFLRVTVSYADGEGSGKQEQFNFSVAVQGPPMPMATPAPEPPERDERPTPGPRSTPEPTAAPTVKPTRVAERPAVPRPEAMARPTPETSGIPMPETGAIFVPEPTLLPTPALAPVGTPVLAQNPTAIPTPTTAPAPATPQVAPDDEGGVNGWLITLLAGGAVAIAAGTFFVVWIRG